MSRSCFIGWITFVLLLGSRLVANGQNTALLTGYVTDATTGKPMQFANVYINGSTQRAVTNEQGAYTLAVVPAGTVEIVASFVGYQSATQKIRFENTSPQKANFQLRISEQMLDAVTVRGNSKRSERNLRLFKKQLFGEPFGRQCLLVNGEVLSFKEDKGHLYATASEPLIIDNQALGYRLIYDLQHFDATPSGKVYSAGTARFQELKPENERQADRFRRNRLTAYHGSARHLMASLIDGTFEEAGFLVYQEDASKPISVERKIITLTAAIGEYKRLVPIQVSKLIQPGRLQVERRLVSSMKLIVFYTRANSTFSPYPDARYAYTELQFPSGQIQMTVNGIITLPQGMEVEGSMGDDRLSTMLPADWKPDAGEMEAVATGALSTQGKLAPPDTFLGSISAGFNERFRLLAPALFVHIDKPFYATGDRLWMSSYLLDATSHQRASGETAMHVDLLTAAGKLVQHQWVRIADGRGHGNFRLSDTLMTGTYRLRAYTDEDDAQRGPAFERSVAIYNLFRDGLAAKSDSVSQQPDIQILPEGGRWISGLPARLGVKIVQPNGHGLSAEGRIVDDSGMEVVRFKTNQNGMTSLLMEPKTQRTYHAEVAYNNQLQRIPLPKPESDGLLLSADAISDTTRLALTLMSSNRTGADTVYILIQQRGLMVDQRKIILQNGLAKISLPMTGWLPGLAQVTLYDAKSMPKCERLFFVPESSAPVRVTLKLNKTQYQPREEVVLNVNLKDNGSAASAALSASITDAGKVPDDSSDANMQAHLLITGELRGRVENPAQYLTSPSAETRKALDDLLLTQGWRRVTGTSTADSLGGVSLSGRILNTKNQPIPGAQIVLTSMAPGRSFVKSADANEQGQFRLPGMAIADTVRLAVQIAGRNAKKLSDKEAYIVQEAPGKQWELDRMIAQPNWPTLQAQLEAARIRQAANTNFYRDKATELLNEVTVRAQKNNDRPDDIKMRSLHNEADATVTFNEKSPAYSNLYDMIQGRFAGVTVVRRTAPPGGAAQPPGYLVSVRGTNSYKSGTQPLFLMDGVPVQDPDGTALMNFTPRDIERVEVLKNAGTTGIYGVRGANGVIAFYSKSARSMQVNAKQDEGMTPVQVIGYPSVQREFYVQRYDLETDTTIAGRIDDRDVLYWKPMIQTDSQGNTQLRFPLSDVVRTLRVVIQGVTATGRPVTGVHLVRVQ
ncbi:carboxypeptidase regulatory-like domain-containing protein [Dyadobacter sp. CY347]|uniref:carboxypeptidase regulatory-like domain-containing protein n=1 Tax=Dyadobacter sp. CY347 TaxID=2909336 RepID=UPI001F22A6AA|nr:carboxypeptidase-like regulatory domain-containing protein [Dyadobacter sp. CY347]MCF2489252.1 carboxypeptidase-like regulatory domain-containing protein [Dyadobacter sp. CY347]